MAKQVMEEKRYEVVFAGTVVAVTRTAELGYRATFEVDRVWKGTVMKRFDLYVWELSPERPRFEVGKHYLALARTLVSSRERGAWAYRVLTRWRTSSVQRPAFTGSGTCSISRRWFAAEELSDGSHAVSRPMRWGNWWARGRRSSGSSACRSRHTQRTAEVDADGQRELTEGSTSAEETLPPRPVTT